MNIPVHTSSILPENIATIKSDVPIHSPTDHNIPIKSNDIPVDHSLDDDSAPKGRDIAANHFTAIHYHDTPKRWRTMRPCTRDTIVNGLPIVLNSRQRNRVPPHQHLDTPYKQRRKEHNSWQRQ